MDINTLGGLFLHTVRSFPRDDFMLYKSGGRFQKLSTEKFESTVKQLSLGLQDLGIKSGDKVILLADNGPYWIMADLAILCLGGITVPLYTTLVSDQIHHLIEDSDARAVICSGRELWSKIDPLRNQLGKVRYFISLLPEEEEDAIPLTTLLEAGANIATIS